MTRKRLSARRVFFFAHGNTEEKGIFPKRLTQRRKGAEDAESLSDSPLLAKTYNFNYKSLWKNDDPANDNFASFAPPRLCEMSSGINFS
jgi:hypothetical protein